MEAAPRASEAVGRVGGPVGRSSLEGLAELWMVRETCKLLTLHCQRWTSWWLFEKHSWVLLHFWELS